MLVGAAENQQQHQSVRDINLAVCWSTLLGVAVGTPLFFSSCDKLWKSWLRRDVYDSCSKAGGPLYQLRRGAADGQLAWLASGWAPPLISADERGAGSSLTGIFLCFRV